jgi:predicted metal-dependent hydrolase
MTNFESQIIDIWNIHNRINLFIVENIPEEDEKEESPEKRKLIKAFRQLRGYYISHEAHHRGNILLTMKKSGFPFSDALKWEIWDWNEI